MVYNDLPDLKTVLRAVENKEIKDFYEVPEEYRNNYDVIKMERIMGLRETKKKGYDVIHYCFFVDELVISLNGYDEYAPKDITTWFDNFRDYYEFLEGDIYDNAFYYQYDFSLEEISKYHIDLEKISYDVSLGESIDTHLPRDYIQEKTEFIQNEKNKSNIKKWINKYNSAKNGEELCEINERHSKSKDKIDAEFYVWNYIQHKGLDAFEDIMELLNRGDYPAYKIEAAIPMLIDHEIILLYCDFKHGTKSARYKHNTRLKSHIRRIESEGVYTEIYKYFDRETHFYCIRTDYHFMSEGRYRIPCASMYKYFETFEEFAKYLENDLSDCNLLNARNINIDNTYKVNENTKLPIDDIVSVKKNVLKKYDRRKDGFLVIVEWENKLGAVIYRDRIWFNYFAEFLGFLNYDLSNADLLYCDGLKNISDFSNIKLEGARLTSNVLERANMDYSKLSFKRYPVDATSILENEKSTSLMLSEEHIESPIVLESDFEEADNKVYYVSDIHLLHKLVRKEVKSYADMICLIQKIIDNLLSELDASSHWDSKTLLIGGDTSSEIVLFELFIKLLRKTIDELSYDITVVFILGNHELWNHEEKNIDIIVQKYRDIVESYKMYLLHDEILYIENHDRVSYITKKEIIEESEERIRGRLRKARLILFGGIGFAGCNETFNANQGVYRATLNRNQEVQLSNDFSKLYDRVERLLEDRCIIVFTHMNINEWKKDYSFHDKWVYVSGHSHLNAYYDDGSRRMYADNQIGYYNDNPYLKYFLIDNAYDWFSNYSDGIYEISRNDYIEFYRGKNIRITFNREINKLYMIKRQGYYCFVHENKSKNLSILNGGTLKKLEHNDIQYYYDNMEAEIKLIKTPLSKYQEIQQQISNEVKKMGGSGRIHGAIIDIDGNIDDDGWQSISYNHLYVNPIDLTITPYYAIDMVEKYVYPNFPALISDKCPKIYEKYQQLLEGQSENSLIVRPVSKEELMIKPVLYTSTDIYKASRELRKMQKLNSNILGTWVEISGNTRVLEEKNLVKNS